MTTRDEVIKAAKAAKLSRFMFDTERCREELERFYDIACKAGMERAAEIAGSLGSEVGWRMAELAEKLIREEMKK